MYEKENVRQYVLSNTEIDLPKIQNKFALSYSEAKQMIAELVQDGTLEYVSGLAYKVIPSVQSEAKNKRKALYLKALWECVKSDEVSVELVSTRCNCDRAEATEAINWMEENCFITLYPKARVILTPKRYTMLFGPPEECSNMSREETYKYIKKIQDESIAKMFFKLGTIENDDGDNEEETDVDDEDIWNFDDDWREVDNEDESNSADAKDLLIESIFLRLKDKSKTEKYIMSLDGNWQFEIKFIQNGEKLKISDEGKTLAQATTNKQKIEEVLSEFAPVVLEDNEISVTIEDSTNTLMALLTLYSAVDAVKKIK